MHVASGGHSANSLQEVPELGGLLHFGLVFAMTCGSAVFGGGEDAGRAGVSERVDKGGTDEHGEGHPLACGGRWR